MSEKDLSLDPGDSSARRSKSKAPRQAKVADRGKLKIGDDWNAIRIIALSQGNPLKAIAEFVENSIDAHAKTITMTRGREHGEHYLSIKDDGDGVPRDEEGRPNFKYVATHIGDSIKRRLNGRILSPELNDSKPSERGQSRLACSGTSAINDHPSAGARRGVRDQSRGCEHGGYETRAAHRTSCYR